MNHVPVWLLLLLSAVMGVAHVLLLPPWEGFDEPAHYSLVRQLADTGELPRLAEARLSAEVEAYKSVGPMPYPSRPPYNQGEGWRYRDFFLNNEVVAEYARFVASPRPFGPGREPNWEAQQPPLYYGLMAGLARLLPAAWGLKETLLALRLASYGLALLGLGVAVWCNARLVPGGGVATALWPVLVPMWIPEMARLGNDSLCVLLVALAWAQLTHLGSHLGSHLGASPLRHGLLGLTLGLGCLTKAFFIGISGGIALYLLFCAFHYRSWTWPCALWFAVPLLALGLPWYGYNLWQGLPFLGANDLVTFSRNPAPLLPTGDALLLWGRSVLTIGKSALWGGTWSFVRPPLVLVGLLALPILELGVFWGRAVIAAPDGRRFALPLVLILPLLAGLGWHAWLWASLRGEAGISPGWYLHGLVGPLGFMIAGALAEMARAPAQRTPGLIGIGIVYGFMFWLGTSLLQALLFAGCAVKAETGAGYTFPSLACLADGAGLVERLEVLAFPGPGLIALVLACGLAIPTLRSTVRSFNGKRGNSNVLTQGRLTRAGVKS